MNALSRHILLITAVLGFGPALMAQTGAVTEQGTTEEVATAGIEVQIDSTLYGMDIFSAIPEGVTVRQDPAIRTALNDKVAADEPQLMSGFRIRLFSDNSRKAREESLSILKRFNEAYPHIAVYRSYAAPNFKVSVGNFRNRVEAEQLLALIKDEYPDAFIVRERFKYPTIGNADISPLPDSLSVFPTDIFNRTND